MAEVIVYPDIEDILVGYLQAELTNRGDTAAVHVSVPNPRPDRFVLVPRVGGPRRNLVVDSPTIAVEAWAATPKQAHDLCQLVRGLLHAAAGSVIGGTPIYRVDEFAGPANLPDPASQQARYILTVSVSCRGAAI